MFSLSLFRKNKQQAGSPLEAVNYIFSIFRQKLDRFALFYATTDTGAIFGFSILETIFEILEPLIKQLQDEGIIAHEFKFTEESLLQGEDRLELEIPFLYLKKEFQQVNDFFKSVKDGFKSRSHL